MKHILLALTILSIQTAHCQKNKYDGCGSYDTYKAIKDKGVYEHVDEKNWRDAETYGRIRVRKDGKYGWVDCLSKKELIAPIYSSVTEFYKGDGRSIVSFHDKETKTYKYGVIDVEGNEILPVKYLSIRFNSKIKNGYTVKKTVNGVPKVGIIDASQKVIVPFEYDLIKGNIIVKKHEINGNTNEFGGGVDETGKVIMPAIKAASSPNGYSSSKKDDHAMDANLPISGNYYHKGKIVSRIYDPRKGDWLIDKSYAKLSRPFDQKYFAKYEDLEGNIGHIDLSGKEHLLQKAVSYESQDFANGFYRVKKDGKYGFLDKHKMLVIPVEYDGAFLFHEKGIVGVKKGNSQGYINQKNEEVIPIKYKRVFEPKRNRIWVFSHEGKYGFYDLQGKLIAPCKYDKATDFDSHGTSNVGLNGKYGMINREGKLVIPLEYEEPTLLYGDGLVMVKKNGKYGFVNTKNETVVPFEYVYAAPFFKGHAAVQEPGDGHITVINKSGEKIFKIAEGVKEVLPFGTSRFLIRKDEKYILINYAGKVIIPPYITKYELNNQGHVRIKTDQGWGVLDAYGHVIVPPIMDEVTHFKDGFYTAQRGDRLGLFCHDPKRSTGLIFSKLSKWSGQFLIMEMPYLINSNSGQFVNGDGAFKISSSQVNPWQTFKVGKNEVSLEEAFKYIHNYKHLYKSYIYNDTPYSWKYHEEGKAEQIIIEPGQVAEVEFKNKGLYLNPANSTYLFKYKYDSQKIYEPGKTKMQIATRAGRVTMLSQLYENDLNFCEPTGDNVPLEFKRTYQVIK